MTPQSMQLPSEKKQLIFSQLKDPNDYASNTPNKMQVAIWGAFIVVAVILSLNDYQSFQLGTYRDDAFYTVLAQSLVHSDQYGLINVPGEQPGDWTGRERRAHQGRDGAYIGQVFLDFGCARGAPPFPASIIPQLKWPCLTDEGLIIAGCPPTVERRLGDGMA